MNFNLQAADLLLVNDDPNGNYGLYFDRVLRQLSYSYHEWKTAQRGSGIPVSKIGQLNNNLIIWFTGDAEQNILNVDEQDSLIRFLANGGRLFLTGQNIAEDLQQQNSPFLAQKLQIGFNRNSGVHYKVPDENHADFNFLKPIFTKGGGAADNQVSQDELVLPTTSRATPAWHYNAQGLAGITIQHVVENSKIVFFGFGFESIGTFPPQFFAGPEPVMAAILGFLQSPTSISDTKPILAQGFVLEPNYPNPFNPSTTIAFRTSSTIRVKITIYDGAGREVMQLVDAKFTAGRHRIVWNATQFASGVYYFRVTSGGESRLRKALLVK